MVFRRFWNADRLTVVILIMANAFTEHLKTAINIITYFYMDAKCSFAMFKETMGRLDDAAKHKVVELRKAGLSFRKIKAVLELENIKVSAQAIYLFLREFQGRPPGRVRPVEVGCSTSSALVQARSGGVQGSWSNVHLQNLIRESSHHSGYLAMSDLAKQKSANVNTTKPCGSMEASSSSSRQGQGDKEEHDIQIVSVTSLAQRNQRGAPASVTKAATSVASSTGAITAALMRRRASPSPATASMLAARKRLLDKALSHRMKVHTRLFGVPIKIVD